MAGRVSLQVVSGPIQGRTFDFEGHDTFLFGRSPDCHAELAAGDTTASRHHFLLEVNPPAARLRDLGSLNGTWVNGTRHGGRELDETPEEGARRPIPEVDLHDGDTIRVGTTVFNVRVEASSPAFAALRPDSDADIEALLREGPSSPPREGAAVPGYALERLVGRGGMGSVYLARRLADGAAVALKLMRPEVVVDQRAREVFNREIEVTRRLRHPSVVELLDHGVAGGVFYFAMEYCPGGSLSGLLLRSERPLAVELATRLSLQVLDGLAAAHEGGYVHRDIKPENVLLVDDEPSAAKLGDFGLAKSFQRAGLSGMTATGTVGGTLFFMPREQLTNFRLLRPASDVWSMGATLYHMLTFSYPRDFAPDRDPLQVILQGGTVPIRMRAPRMPPALADVIDRSVADDLGVRYPTAAEFRDALRRAL
jgi:hypothetical protein